MADNPLVVALLKEYRDEALVTRTEIGKMIGKERGYVAGICRRNGIAPWPPIAKVLRHKRSCCFPVGQPDDDDFHLCGKRREGHSFLCEEHRGKVWVPSGKVLPLKK